MLVCRKHRHIVSNLRENLNRRKWVFAEPRDSADQIERVKVRIRETKNFPFHFFLVIFQLVNVIQTLAEFDCLFRRDSPINGSLNFFNWRLASTIHKW